MVEKANDTIKNWTINVHHYDTVEEMKQDILLFMIYYNLKRRHSWIYTEIRRKTPYETLEYYYNKTPDKFKETLIEFRKKIDKLLNRWKHKYYTLQDFFYWYYFTMCLDLTFKNILYNSNRL